MTNPFNPNTYAGTLAAYGLLRADFRRYLEYVHPVDSNEECYSHRAYELLLRASAEFESTAKIIAKNRGVGLKKEPSIRDLSVLYDLLTLDEHGVGVAAWQPTPKLFFPLKDWKAKPHGLDWFHAYNNVKHDRIANFSQANLRNVASAIGANFLLLVKVDAIPTVTSRHRHHGQTHTEYWYEDEDFTVYKPA